MATFNDNAPAAPPPGERELDAGQIQRLIAQIEQDLAGMPESTPGIDRLRSDLDALKATLAQQEQHAAKGSAVADKSSLRSSLQKFAASMEGEVLKDSPYIAEIGRILGMV